MYRWYSCFTACLNSAGNKVAKEDSGHSRNQFPVVKFVVRATGTVAGEFGHRSPRMRERRLSLL